MTSVSSQPQFRYTQPPSKVLHLRNLPWECTEEELIELGKPFGKIVNTKCNVGANRNQAFIEFEELNQAIAMISYYASSLEPAQVRGKTVYLQYSNRQEITNNKTAGDTASNVLLVTIEGPEASSVSIDVLHLVFSAFGFVHKIATFEKTAGFQVDADLNWQPKRISVHVSSLADLKWLKRNVEKALVQFSEVGTATAAKDALEGRIIPRYLLPENVGPCTLRINFSGHTDLNVKFQSHRSRDYTNPYLPVAPSAIDGSGLLGTGLDGRKQELESNVLLASIENLQYAVTVDVLHQVFSHFGSVQKIAIFEKNSGLQALIQYPDVQTAIVAKEALEGHCIYDGGFCKLHLTYSRHTDLNVKANNDRSRDYTVNDAVSNSQPSVLGQQPLAMPATAVSQYGSIPYVQTANGVVVASQPVGQWDAAGMGLAPPTLPAQVPNHMYMLPGTTTLQSTMSPGMMQAPIHGGPIPASTHSLPPYGQ